MNKLTNEDRLSSDSICNKLVFGVMDKGEAS